MVKIERFDVRGVETTLGQLLSCPLCCEPYIEAGNKHTFKPNCNCIPQDIRISVGGKNVNNK